MIKLVYFDCDGTIINTLRDLGEAMNKALTRSSYPTFPLDQYNFMLGEGAKKLSYYCLPDDKKDSEEEILSLLAKFNEEYNAEPLKYSAAYTHMNELFEYLEEHNIKIVVLTNKFQNQANYVVTSIFPMVNFTAILGVSEEVPPKPSPIGINMILKEFKIKPEECAYLGDTNTDMETALNASIKYRCGVSWGFRPVQELLENGATHILNDPLELVTLIEE